MRGNARAIILVHGAFQGGWVWNKVAPRLRTPTTPVYTPTLRGLGSRKNELTRDIGLMHHIDDICSIIDENRLENVTLVGHSYGGIVISGVANKRSEQVSRVIYLDAPIPEENQSLLDVLGEETAKFFMSLAEKGDGWRVESFPAAAFGLEKEEDINWAFPQHTSQSLKSFTDKVSVVAKEHSSNIIFDYIRCTSAHPFSSTQAEKAKAKGWNCYEIPTPHSPMITHPDLFYDLMVNKIFKEMNYAKFFTQESENTKDEKEKKQDTEAQTAENQNNRPVRKNS